MVFSVSHLIIIIIIINIKNKQNSFEKKKNPLIKKSKKRL